MKYSKRILSLLGLAVIVGTLTSCDVNRNTKTPTGNLNLDAKYAQLSDNNKISVSVNEMYNQFRSNGYSTVLTKIKEKLFESEIKNIKYDDYKEEIDEYLLSQIYSVSTVEDFNDLEEDEIDICIQKFIDNQLSTYGIDLSSIEKSAFKPTYNKDEDILKYSWGKYEDMYSSYKYTLAIIDYAKDYLESIRTYKTLYDVNGEEVENDYYLPKVYDADDEDAEEQRENIYNKIKDLTATKDLLDGKNPYENEDDYVTKNQAIVVKFASKKEAEKYIIKTIDKLGYDLSKSGISNNEVQKFYVTLFDLYYKTKNIGDFESVSSSEYTSFISDYDNDEMLDEIGTTAIDFMKENLVDMDNASNSEDSFYLSEPFNISGDNIYYMCCRISIYEGPEWDDLSEDEKKNLCDKYIDNVIVENWATESYANGLVEDLLQGTLYTTSKDGQRGTFELEIFDPIYENQYYNSYEDYYDFSAKKNFNNSYVFTLNYTPCEGDAKSAADAKYSVDDSYDDLNKIYGADKASSILISKYLAETFLIDKIDEDTIAGYEDGIKTVIKSFKKNNTSYSKKMGLSNYLVLQYGFDNQNDILYYNLMASDLISAYSSYYGKFWNEGVYINSKDSEGKYLNEDMTDELVNSVYYQLGENLLSLDENNNLLKIFYDYAAKKYDSYYSLDISHMLISVDYDHDGNNDDPNEFYDSLANAFEKSNFREAILTLADAIVKEAAIIKTSTKVEALQFIATTFNNPGYGYVLKCEDYKGKTWDEFTKDYEFSLRAEDLSTIDYSNGSNYVEEFTDEVIALYDKLSSDEYEEVAENISDYGYWNYEPYKYKVDEEDDNYQTLFENNQIDINATDLEQLTDTVYGWHMLYVYDMTSQTSCQFTRSNDSSLSTSGVKNDDGQILYYKKDENGNYEIYTEKEAKGDGTSVDTTVYTKLSSIKTWEYQDIIVYDNDDDTTEDDIKLYVSGYSSEDYASIAQIFIYFMETVNLGSVSSLRSTTSAAVGNVVSDVISRYTNSSFQSWRLYKQIGNIEFLEGSESNTLKASDLSNRYGLLITKLENTIDSYENLEEDDIFYGWFDDDKDWTIDLTEDYSDYTKLND